MQKFPKEEGGGKGRTYEQVSFGQSGVSFSVQEE